MNTPDLEVLYTLRNWLTDKRQCVLVTVVQTWGSSPRAVGSLMCIAQNGDNEGSVSGGCVEEDLIEKVRSFDFSRQQPVKYVYGVDKDQAQRFGLPCGGKLELVIENISNVQSLNRMLDCLGDRKTIVRQLNLLTGEVELKKQAHSRDVFYDGTTLIKTYGPVWRLIIIGAGHLSRHLAYMAGALDYEIIICDPREEYTSAWNVANTRIDHRMPDDVVAALGDDEFTAIVALTHDPKLDDMALMQALDSKAFYVGALGSRLNNEKRKQRLASLGVSQHGLARLHGPVGLPIGSHTPPEIAISILAEITACRHGIAFEMPSVANKKEVKLAEQNYA